jgi:hypothetical protein
MNLRSKVEEFVLQNYGLKIRNDFNPTLQPFMHKACAVDSYVCFLFSPHMVRGKIDDKFVSQFSRLILCRISDLIAELMPVARQRNYKDEEYSVTIALHLALLHAQMRRSYLPPTEYPIFCVSPLISGYYRYVFRG